MVPEPVERKLAAILSADVVGYSRLMAEDEAATIRTLTDYREDIAMRVRQHRGRVVDTPGDNLLAEFPTALDAVRCAVETQGVLRALNASLSDERRMDFRIGVHMGDVAAEGERIYGDGVNIAARLEALAEAGGVCISATVHEQVRNKLDAGFTDIGDHAVKNIPDQIHVYRVQLEDGAALPWSEPKPGRPAILAVGVLVLLVVGGLLLWNFDRERSPSPGARLSNQELSVPGFSGVPAIAVLAFDNLSGDPDQEYFADGIAEDLITRLSSWRRFPVIARNSSFVYKGKAVDVQQVSRELGVRYVVEGSVRRAGERVRISAQLIDATTGHHVWAETYDRELRDIFALQDEISEAIAASVQPEIRRAEVKRVVRRQPESLDAYESQLRGLWRLWKFTPEHNAAARRFFGRAVELDPHYVDPRFGVALTHFADVVFEWSDARSESVAALERSARECVELDAESARCQLSLGFAYMVTGKQAEEIAAFERSVRLDPSLGAAYGWLGMALAITGRPEEALANLEKARRLDPYDPATQRYLLYTAWAHFAAGRYAEAVAEARRAVEMEPGSSLALRTLAASYAQLGRLEEARNALEEAVRFEPDLSLRKVQRQNPTTEPDFLARWLDGLRVAGLKEE
jgi:adenylate cyclase